MRLFLLIIFSILFGVAFIVLVIALTNVYPIQQLTDNRFIIAIIFISLGGFFRQAYIKYKESILH
jgi:hypothetical protein